jgi:hypothetical protein
MKTAAVHLGCPTLIHHPASIPARDPSAAGMRNGRYRTDIATPSLDGRTAPLTMVAGTDKAARSSHERRSRRILSHFVSILTMETRRIRSGNYAIVSWEDANMSHMFLLCSRQTSLLPLR